MRKVLLAAALLASVALPSKADVILGGQNWTGTGSNLTLSATVPGGNQPQNAPCVICGENQPQQPAGFGYNDYQNGGNLTSVTAFSDQGNGGRNTLADNTFATGYTIGSGSPLLSFLLANGDTAGNLGFSIGFDVNDTGTAQTLNSFWFLDLTTHTVLSSYVCLVNCNVPSFNNGTGFPDYTISGLTLNGVSVGDTVLFVARMTNLNDGPDSFFIEPGPTAAVPAPIVGAGLPGLFAACMAMFGLNRRRKRQQSA
jgi:hypothetical protein